MHIFEYLALDFIQAIQIRIESNLLKLANIMLRQNLPLWAR